MKTDTSGATKHYTTVTDKVLICVSVFSQLIIWTNSMAYQDGGVTKLGTKIVKTQSDYLPVI